MSIYAPTFFKLSDADFVPKRREISDVTNAINALVTTTEAHGYSIGQLVRLHVSKAYDMVLDGVEAKILTVPTDTTFTVNVDTRSLSAYDTPIYFDGEGFTQSHVVPITGTEVNEA